MLILGLKGLRLSRNMSLSFFSSSGRVIDMYCLIKGISMCVAKSTVSGSNVALLIPHEELFRCYLLS